MDGNGQPENNSLGTVAPGHLGAWPPAPKRSRKLRHVGQGNLTVEGITGTVYRFYGHGAVQKVKEEDSAGLLELAQDHQGCCGNSQRWREELLVEVRE